MKRYVQIGLITGAALALAGCSKAYEVYEVDGVSDKFCVPKPYVVSGVAWVPPDKPDAPKGFAFNGCWRGDLVAPQGCAFRKEVKGGFVEPAGATGWGWRWQDFAGSHIYEIALRADSFLEIEDEGATVVVSNTKRDWNWYVWRKKKSLAKIDKPYLEDDDRLVAICQSIDVSLPGKNGARKMISCDRHVQGNEYVLKYSFESSERVPHDIEKLDVQVFAQIDSWRCKK